MPPAVVIYLSLHQQKVALKDLTIQINLKNFQKALKNWPLTAKSNKMWTNRIA